MRESNGTKKPILFIDRAMDCHTLVEALIKAGANIQRHGDIFKPNTKDPEWLLEAGKNGWCILTKDKRIRYNLLEIEALLTARVGSFILVSPLNSDEMAKVITEALPKIEEIALTIEKPFVYNIDRDGNLKKVDIYNLREARRRKRRIR